MPTKAWLPSGKRLVTRSFAAWDAYSPGTTISTRHAFVVFLSICARRRWLNAYIVVAEGVQVGTRSCRLVVHGTGFIRSLWLVDLTVGCIICRDWLLLGRSKEMYLSYGLPEYSREGGLDLRKDTGLYLDFASLWRVCCRWANIPQRSQISVLSKICHSIPQRERSGECVSKSASMFCFIFAGWCCRFFLSHVLRKCGHYPVFVGGRFRKCCV